MVSIIQPFMTLTSSGVPVSNPVSVDPGHIPQYKLLLLWGCAPAPMRACNCRATNLLILEHVRPEILTAPDCKALFLAMDGLAGLTASGIIMAVVPYLRAAGIDKGSCHLLRHAMATQMLENGADLRWIQAMLGHRSVQSTQIYTQVSIRALQAVHASTHPAEQREQNRLDVADEE